MPSFYCPELNATTTQIIITGDELHHLSHVMRHKPGDVIRLISATGWVGKGTITNIDKKAADVTIMKADYYHPLKTPFAVAFSLLRNKNDEWMVEKLTELGVKDLFPILTENSVRTPSPNTLTRFRQTALTAVKQCDNPHLPIIHEILNLVQLPSALEQMHYIPVFASEKRPDTWLDNLEQGISYCFIIGPEGGFSTEELQFFEINKVADISLSHLVLRAETAAVCAASQFVLLNK
jgi:16S rRNA (uracil1498-N3)-methyltransferase